MLTCFLFNHLFDSGRTGPAYVCLFVEVLAQAAEEQGLDKDTALRLATRTVAGTGSMLETTMESPSNTRRKVTRWAAQSFLPYIFALHRDVGC